MGFSQGIPDNRMGASDGLQDTRVGVDPPG